MTPPEFAKLHGVSVQLVRRWIQQGRVKCKVHQGEGRKHYWITQRERPVPIKRGQG